MENKKTEPSLCVVSLTGADDAVNISDLKSLSEKYRLVEWALLYYPERFGSDRNPSEAWLSEFFNSGIGGSTSLHLCGKQIFNLLLSNEREPSCFSKANRIQVNINARQRDFSDDDVIKIYFRLLTLGVDIILQYHDDSQSVINAFIQKLTAYERSRTHILMDSSRGTGVKPDTWSVPDQLSSRFCGFAGGIGEGNVSETVAKLNTLNRPYWIDMESSLRTSNKFDLVKVEKILEITHKN